MAVALGASFGLASTASAAMTVLHSWDFAGTAGTTAPDPTVDTVAGFSLDAVGSLNHDSAGTGIDFANAGGNLNNFAQNYYENTTGTIGLTNSAHWGFSAVVNLNAIPSTSAGIDPAFGGTGVPGTGEDVNGESTVMQIGFTPGTSVMLQTFNTAGGADGTPNWAIHIPGVVLFSADPTQGGGLTPGVDQHLEVIFDGAWKLFIDGSEVPLNAAGGFDTVINPDTGLRIGASNNGDNVVRGFDGIIRSASISEFQEVTVIPEPASMALLGIGGLALLRRRRH
ncbi:MAG: PEP-CTERM sorting domain-containing protein [Phycisphaeraceae bacterium]